MSTTEAGPRVFVSHASADGDYADKFVHDVLVRGARLDPETDVFYSSDADTGVRSGEYLMERVRGEAGRSALIVALVTPVYQTRPVCIAELGAAWARGVPFPVMAPGMDRSELEGVLPGLLIKSVDDESVLDELADRIQELGFAFSSSSFGTGKTHWKSDLRRGVRPAPLPRVVTTQDFEQLKQELESTRNALDETNAELEEQRSRNDRLSKAKSAAEIREADLPTGESEQFEALCRNVIRASHGLSEVVVDAVWHSVAGQALYLPSHFENPDDHDAILMEVKDGRLAIDDDTGEISPVVEFPAVEQAREAVVRLGEYLDPAKRSEDFSSWFRSEYGTPMDLTKKACWDAVM